MPSSAARRWLHPQTVPRGFLRLYILTLLSRSPESGYSIIQKIDERTEGAWRPGPGTMYPLLKSMVKGGSARSIGVKPGAASKTYALTVKGRRELEEMRRTIAGFGRKEGVMGKLFSDLLPGPVFAAMVLNRLREGSPLFREKLAEVPSPERESLLREYGMLLQAQLDWTNSELKSAGTQRGVRVPPRAVKP